MDLAEPAVTVVLPTYNEADSLPVVVPSIVASLHEAELACEIIVVDDDSKDDTAQVAALLAERYPVRVVRRQHERGLATAVLAGFADARAPVCVVMDADGSHPVAALPAMVRMIAEDKADIVVGSRHLPGGGSRNWPLFSQLKSKFAALLTFGLTSMTDPTTGLMALRKSLLNGLSLDPVGWKIVLEIVVKAAPVRVAEVPIIFEERALGQSKQSLRVFLQYAAHVSKLYGHRYPGLAELTRFCAVGLVGLLVDLSVVVTAKLLWGLDTRLCAVLGFSVAVTTNYWLNRRFTFARARDLPALWSYFTYVGTNLLGLSVRVSVIHALIVLFSLDRGYGYLLSNALGISLATLINFIGAKHFAFDPERLLLGHVTRTQAVRPERALPARLKRAALLLVLAFGCLAAAKATVLRTSATPDESVNITMAENMLVSLDYLIRPSVHPHAGPDAARAWVDVDLPALGNTPFFPALLALLRATFGVAGMGLLPFFSWLATLLFAALFAREHSTRAGVYTACLLASSPAFLAQSLLLEFEPLLTASATAGLYFAARGSTQQRRWLCFAGGALLGLAFLTKMWLTVPCTLAACAFVLVQATVVRSHTPSPLLLRRSVLYAASGFALTASTHLILIALVSPSDLPHWIRSVYLGIFSGEGVSGGKLSALSGYSPKPLWYYPAVLYRDHFYAFLLVLFGLPALLRRGHPAAMAVLAMAFGAGLGVIVLSVPAVKEPLYVLSVVPFLYILAGTSLAELDDDLAVYLPVNAAVVKAAMTVAALSVLAVWVSTVSHPHLVPAGYALLHTFGMLGCGAVAFARLTGRKAAAGLVLVCAAALLLLVAHQARDRNQATVSASPCSSVVALCAASMAPPSSTDRSTSPARRGA